MLAAIRIRGNVGVRQPVEQALTQLSLPQRNACMIYPDNESIRGMLTKAKDYITYGEVPPETVEQLLEKRGTVNGSPLPSAVEQLGYDTVPDLVKALNKEETSIHDLRENGLNTPFNLNAPSGGFANTKEHVNQGGSLGERPSIDSLLQDMV